MPTVTLGAFADAKIFPSGSTLQRRPGRGKVTTVISWKSVENMRHLPLTATTRLVGATIADANPANNSAAVTVTVK